MKALTTIRSSQSGWVVYFDNDVNNFKVFRSDEPERFVKFLTENVANIKVDQLLTKRQAEMDQAAAQFDAAK
jgi:hypothetical protein